MVQLVIFVNLFFIPLLPLYVIYRKRNKLLEPNLNLLFQYGIVAACNIPLTKIPIFFIKKITGIFISIDSGYYTVAAFLPTVLVILLCKFHNTYPDHVPWKEKFLEKGIKGVARDLVPACILIFVSCFMMFVFEPILLYATNMNDFWFDFQIVIGPILHIFFRIFLTGIVLIFTIYNADLWISKRLVLYKGIILTGSIVFFLLYLQGNWLAGNLPVLTGDEIVWENYGKFENFVLISGMIVLTGALIISVRKCGLNRTIFYATACTLVIFVMLFASILPTVVEKKTLESKDTFTPTWANYNTISSNRNFLIFLIDTVDSPVFYDVMMENDDFRGMMEDFTYYPDTLSVYLSSRDSIPNILTGTVYRNETNFPDYCTSAYNQSPLFEKLTENGYGINLYSTGVTWNGKKNYDIENGVSIYDTSIDLNDFMKQELKYIIFKYFPYGLKQFSRIETLNFDACKIINSEYAGFTYENLNIYREITENRLKKQDTNYFQFIHCEGAHVPFNLDKDLNTIKNGTYTQKIAASLTMIKAYLQRLKDNDAYDNSVIVIMADHGHTQAYEGLARGNPILFIKGMNEKHDQMLESDRAISYVDLQDAFCDLIDGKQSTEIFTELEPGRTRTIIWQKYTKEYHKVEYETTGTAREPWKIIPTGNVYDLEE